MSSYLLLKLFYSKCNLIINSKYTVDIVNWLDPKCFKYITYLYLQPINSQL